MAEGPDPAWNAITPEKYHAPCVSQQPVVETCSNIAKWLCHSVVVAMLHTHMQMGQQQDAVLKWLHCAQGDCDIVHKVTVKQHRI